MTRTVVVQHVCDLCDRRSVIEGMWIKICSSDEIEDKHICPVCVSRAVLFDPETDGKEHSLKDLRHGIKERRNTDSDTFQDISPLTESGF